MKNTMKVSLLASAILALASVAASAQATSSGTLTVTATIDPSISLTFDSDPSGLALSSGSGTNAATLAFGNIQAYGYTAPTGVTQALNSTTDSLQTSFYVSTPVDVRVQEANDTSANYSLTAELGSADTVNTWTVGTQTVTYGSTATVAATASYDTANAYAIKVSIPFTNTTGSISNTINFVATAN